MEPWAPATKDEVERLLADAIAQLESTHRTRFEAILVQLRTVPVLDSPTESVFVVAEHQGRIIYWSDVEEGWEYDSPNEHGGIDSRGCNQFELSHIAHQIFGAHDVR
jgi:hypothetical protein